MKHIYFATIALATLIFAGCHKTPPPVVTATPPAPDYRTEIWKIDVIRHEALARIGHHATNSPPTVWVVSFPDLGNALISTDTSRTPPEFRDAWQSWLVALTSKPKGPGLSTLAEGLANPAMGIAYAVIQSEAGKSKKSDELTEAFTKLRLVAASYGDTNFGLFANPRP